MFLIAKIKFMLLPIYTDITVLSVTCEWFVVRRQEETVQKWKVIHSCNFLVVVYLLLAQCRIIMRMIQTNFTHCSSSQRQK